MPRFLVTLCRATYEYADVEVESESEGGAEAYALESAPTAHWTGSDDPTPGPASVVNVEDIPETVTVDWAQRFLDERAKLMRRGQQP